MKHNRLDKLLVGLELPGECLPGTPIVEILGNGRVLIENQLGVCTYDRKNMIVKVSGGKVCISGDDLEMQQMTKDRLVITGVIFGITLTDWS